MTKRKSKNISLDELNEIHDLGYTIREHWIGPIEGWEFMPVRLGSRQPIAFVKSQRAAYNAIVAREANR